MVGSIFRPLALTPSAMFVIIFAQLLLTALFVSIPSEIVALDNGLARTPPMGWLSWARFMCETNCTTHPRSCISERLYMDMADIMATEGYRDAGYVYVNIDDCWPAMQRDAQGRLQSDPVRFSHSIPFLAKYMHDRGLKLGLYEDYGTKTCGGYPGVLEHMQLDAETMASWGIDMLKLDGCYSDPKTMDKGYPEFGGYLNKTGKFIVYSCSWPAYQIGQHPAYPKIAEYCNLWRNFDDISIDWNSIMSIINFYDLHKDVLIPVNGPGSWNDPDMIVVGNPELTVDQAQAQMAIWSIYSAPLLMSNDLRLITKAQKDILLNRDVIAIDQDPLGIMGRLVANTTYVGSYVKPVTPVVSGNYSFALAFLNRHATEQADVTVQLSNLGLTHTAGYNIEDLFSGFKYGILTPSYSIHVVVNPTGVVMLKATAIQG